MSQETTGVVISVAKQWWLKVNTKVVRTHALDGAVFPHVIKVRYAVDGVDYTKRKWIGAGCAVPAIGSTVTVIYDADRPNRAKVTGDFENSIC
jgi:hypothetical protein